MVFPPPLSLIRKWKQCKAKSPVMSHEEEQMKWSSPVARKCKPWNGHRAGGPAGTVLAAAPGPAVTMATPRPRHSRAPGLRPVRRGGAFAFLAGS